jgi:hypothetical protein
MVRHRGKSPDMADTSLEAGDGGHLPSFSKLSDALHGDAAQRKPFHPTLLPVSVLARRETRCNPSSASVCASCQLGSLTIIALVA